MRVRDFANSDISLPCYRSLPCNCLVLVFDLLEQLIWNMRVRHTSLSRNIADITPLQYLCWIEGTPSATVSKLSDATGTT